MAELDHDRPVIGIGFEMFAVAFRRFAPAPEACVAGPIQYPKDTMDQDVLLKKAAKNCCTEDEDEKAVPNTHPPGANLRNCG